jgi:DsbC/DsbD-like thiol-disulfide interchange protein
MKRRIIRLSRSLLLWVFFAFFPCFAENPLQVSMISERDALVPGRTLWVGFRLQHPPGYHSYTRHPGGIGLATSVTWDLPPGFTAGEIHWPTPTPVMMGEHRAQGYRGEVLLMVPIFAPTSAIAVPVTLRAKLDWLCCGSSCHHAHQVPFSLTLPIRDQSELDPTHVPLFRSARRSWPIMDPRWNATFRSQADKIILLIQPPPGSLPLALRWPGPWFATDDGVIDSTQPQRVVHHRDGRTEMHLALHELATPPTEQLDGILVFSHQGLIVRATRQHATRNPK